MTIKEHLQKARDLISDPSRWCQGFPAKDRYGYYVPPRDEHANQWCSIGALVKIGCPLGPAYEALVNAAGGPVVKVNDFGTHAEVMAMFDRAIAACKESEEARAGRGGE